MKDNEVHIGSVIKRVFDESGMSPEDFADAIYHKRNSVYYIFMQRSLNTPLLISISKVLDYNFFLEYDFFKDLLNYRKTTITLEIETNDLDKITIPDNILKLIKK